MLIRWARPLRRRSARTRFLKVGKGHLILHDRYDALPKWAVDGGNGSVASVLSMDEDAYELAWNSLRRLMGRLSDVKMTGEDIANIMGDLDPER